MEHRVNIVQGEFRVSADPEEVITTLLGSCVAACLYDPSVHVGGMNHFLLPGDPAARGAGTAERVAVHLMELLVNGLLKLGANRASLQAKLFGGAKTVKGLQDIGAANGRFAREFLMREGIAVTGASLGGETGRRIMFWPVSGRAKQQFLSSTAPAIVPLQPANQGSGDVELF